MTILRLTPPNNDIPFIVTTPARQSVEEKRKLIRSHVMRGKNRTKPLRSRSWISGGKANDTFDTKNENALCIPAKVGGEFSLTAFPTEISPDVLETIWNCKRIPLSWCRIFNRTNVLTNYFEVKHAMFPFEFGPGSNQPELSWFEPIWNDAACLHFTIFIAKRYLDFVHGQKGNSKMALAHFVKALAILQQRLASSDTELSISNSTILVVVGLTMAATILSDLETALKHLNGLHRIFILRGGMSAFKGNRQLQTKIFRQVRPITLTYEHHY